MPLKPPSDFFRRKELRVPRGRAQLGGEEKWERQPATTLPGCRLPAEVTQLPEPQAMLRTRVPATAWESHRLKNKATHPQFTGRLVTSWGYVCCRSRLQPTSLPVVQRHNLVSFTKQKCF